MNRSQSGWSLAWPLLIALFLSGPVALAQIEDPDNYPGVWYRIAFDNDGNRILGDGDGSGWYYYSTSDVYRMWFYNEPYDPDRKGYLRYEAYIKPVDPSKTTYVSIRFNWTTPEWSALGSGGPPTPSDVPTKAEESLYMSGYGMYTVDNLGSFESIEPVRSHTISGYNPEWISIDIIGRNAYVYRGAWHECLEKSSSDSDDSGFHVCCHWSTGDCYSVFGTGCSEPYEELAPGRSCDDCKRGGALSMDFGDAPDPGYPTLLASDGARHTVVANVYLGKGVDVEADAKTDAMAGGDTDDGVTFDAALQPGWPASVTVNASTDGYLNAWVDFDGNGSFADRGEQVFIDTRLDPGANELTFDVPDEAVPGTTFARFRFSTRGLLGYDGLAADGEVEDCAVEITTSYEPYQTSGVTSLKWNQPPSTVDAANPYLFNTLSIASSLDRRRIASDDFEFEAGRPITGIHWWGSFDGWTESYLPSVLPLAFHIGIWTDVPDYDPGDPASFGHPGTLIWESYCTQWAWALAGYQETPEGTTLGETCFQFSYLLSQDEWFQPVVEETEKETTPASYWISIAAVYDPVDSPAEHVWSWLTRSHEAGEAAALVQEVTPGAWPPSAGVEWLAGKLVASDSSVPWDMAFQLTTYGAASKTEKTRTDASKARTASGLHQLALKAGRWLDAMR
ncbi:MAG: hypothetical protein JSW27_22445 [Phycisphaerales bacterium]|nr:MAG: hypothetical protein JSW27_22445 [Phycisphaerales bacterium]